MRCKLNVLTLSKVTDKNSMRCLLSENASLIQIKRLLTRWSRRLCKILKLLARSSQGWTHLSKQGERMKNRHQDPLSCLLLRLIIHYWALSQKSSGKHSRLSILCLIYKGKITIRHQPLKKPGVPCLIYQDKITKRHRPNLQLRIRWN